MRSRIVPHYSTVQRCSASVFWVPPYVGEIIKVYLWRVITAFDPKPSKNATSNKNSGLQLHIFTWMGPRDSGEKVMVMLLVLTLSEQGAVRGNGECEVRYHVTFVLVLLPSLGPSGPVAGRRGCISILIADSQIIIALYGQCSRLTQIFPCHSITSPGMSAWESKNNGMLARAYRLYY